MARRDALLRLHKSLTKRRDELRHRLGGELSELRRYGGDSGDSADLAFDSAGEEVLSQLAQLEAKELLQVERSLQKLRQGSYGVCEGCAKKIPVARLNALPFSTTCITCQRELEIYGEISGRTAGSWDRISEGTFDEQREVKLSDLEMDFSK